jgi:hypothetical protein
MYPIERAANGSNTGHPFPELHLLRSRPRDADASGAVAFAAQSVD